MARDDSLPLDQPAEFLGEWWPHDEPDKRATGRLTYDPDGGLLLDAMGGPFLDPGREFPSILGMTIDGRRVTLRNSFMIDGSAGIPGGLHAIVRANQAFVGIHAERTTDLSFHWLQARMANLVAWSQITGIDAQPQPGVLGRISYGTPQPLPLARYEGALLAAFFELSGDIEPRGRPARVLIEQLAWVRSQHKFRRGFDQLFEHLSLFNKLLAFATGTECPLVELMGEATIRSFPEFGSGRTFPERAPVWVLFPRVSAGRDPRPTNRMTFLLDDARALGLRPVERWFRRAPLLAPIYSLYVSELRARTLDHRFLLTTQALEALHARLRPRPRSVKFIDRIEQLVAALPVRLRSPIPTHYAELTRDTRNFYTHWNPSLQRRAATGERLYALTRSSKGLLEVTLLMALGFSKTKVTELVERNNHLVHGWQGFYEI